MAKQLKTLGDVVDRLVDHSYQIIEWKMFASLRDIDSLPDDYVMYDHDELNRILSMVKPLLASAQQTRKIKAETAKDIVSLMKKGKISFTEARELMTAMKMELDLKNEEDKAVIQQKIMSTLSEEE